MGRMWRSGAPTVRFVRRVTWRRGYLGLRVGEASNPGPGDGEDGEGADDGDGGTTTATTQNRLAPGRGPKSQEQSTRILKVKLAKSSH